MFDYLPIPLLDCRLSWGAMSRLQTTLPGDASLGRLMAYARAGSHTVLAHDGARLIGFMVMVPASFFAPTETLCRALGIPRPTTVVATMIHVDREYRRLGVAGRFLSEALDAAGRQGKAGCLAYGYETREILAWIGRTTQFKDTSLNDEKGDPVFFARCDADAPHAGDGPGLYL